MFKKIGSFFIGFLMFIFIFLISILLSARMFFSSSSMTYLMEICFDNSDIMSIIIDDEDVSNFEFDEKEMQEAYGEFLSDYFKYLGQVSGAKKPSLEKIKTLYKEYINQYREEYNIDISDSEIDEILLELDEELEELLEEATNEIEKSVVMVFKIVYSNVILIGLILLLIACVGLNYLLRRETSVVVRHLGITLIINFITYIAGTLLINSVMNIYDTGEVEAVKLLLNVFIKVGFISLVIGIISIVLSIILKNKNKPVLDM